MVKLNSGYDIPALGLGVYLVPQEDAATVVYNALKIGYRHIDTAQVYKNEHESAQGLLKWINEGLGKRSEVFFTTKVGSPEGYDHVVQVVNESLEKTKGLEYLDLVLIHSPLTDKEKRIASWKALQDLKDKGLIRSIGVSNYGNHHIKELEEWDGLKYLPAVNQIEINPWLRREDITKYDLNLGIQIEAYSPLTRGYRLKDPELAKIAKKYNKSPAQILIKWSLQQGNIVLVKSNSEARQLENFEVQDWELSKEDLDFFADEYYVSHKAWDPVTYQG
ncbi:unnamed protein product [Kuraishia capsulata CBS 1993]|uniref:2-dehydropantolactone reductase n=1 Tax=Kuraishia capsulata CBS 1993 TaxID=1382522 RepID=W6MMK5_9ASCO|nr:uncharacterized protein KUCA_T00002143001 [Kuraishia capsulata CBS 1993]CDK26172.1 unnamed protein product [Kuraishia capsulata CBS 1993]